MRLLLLGADRQAKALRLLLLVETDLQLLLAAENGQAPVIIDSCREAAVSGREELKKALGTADCVYVGKMVSPADKELVLQALWAVVEGAGSAAELTVVAGSGLAKEALYLVRGSAAKRQRLKELLVRAEETRRIEVF